jgi:hypothetical protein
MTPTVAVLSLNFASSSFMGISRRAGLRRRGAGCDGVTRGVRRWTVRITRVRAAAAALARAGACALAVGLAACRGPSAPEAFVLDDGVKMGADGRLLTRARLPGYLRENPAWDGRRIALAAARGETVAFQVMIRAGAATLRGADVRISDLAREGGGAIPAAALTRFREWYVAVALPSESPAGSAGPGEYPDALVPAEAPGLGLPVDVPPHRVQGVWIDCPVPRSAEPGTYRGTVEVVAAGGTLRRFELALTVRPLALPEARHLRWRMGYSGFEVVPEALGIAEGSAGWLSLERELYRLLWEGHGVVPTTHYHDLPVAARGRGEALEIDWREFDRRFGPYLDGSAFEGGVPIPVFSLPLNLHAGWPGRLPDDPARVDVETLAAAAREIGRHFDARGWRVEDAFVYVADEPGAARFESVRRAAAALREGDPRIRRSVAFYTEFGRDAPAVVRTFAGLVTMWDLAGDHADLPAVRARQAAGDRVGVYQGGEPFLGGEALDFDGLALTTWPWIAWRYGLDDLFLYNVTEWTYFRLDRARHVPWAGGKREIWENPLNQSWRTNSQGVLVYPGPYAGVRGVVPTIRLKQARRGMQDYEYLWLAARAGHRAGADAIARRLVRRALHEAGPLGRQGAPGAWARDPRSWAAARAELAALAGGAPAGGGAASSPR